MGRLWRYKKLNDNNSEKINIEGIIGSNGRQQSSSSSLSSSSVKIDGTKEKKDKSVGKKWPIYSKIKWQNAVKNNANNGYSFKASAKDAVFSFAYSNDDVDNKEYRQQQQQQQQNKSQEKQQKHKRTIYKCIKKILRKTFKHQDIEDVSYIEVQRNIKIINNNLQEYLPNFLVHDNETNKSDIVMQDIRIRVERPNHGSPNHQHQQRPINLFPKAKTITCDENVNITSQRSPSSEEDNSPTEMNNCRRLIEKPPLVKRLTMGLLRSTEDSRPLVHNTSSSITSGSTQTISDGYVNEGICDPDRIISSKFGDSCRQSLMSMALESRCMDNNHEFDFKKNYLRETSSANSSPKIFASSIRSDHLSLSEQNELKGAAWFQAGIPREISLEVLSRQSPGAFLVRQSSSKPGCFALSLRVPPPAPKVAHYLILKTPRGYKIKGFTKEFSSLRALITHHSVMPELLPVPLALPRPTNMLPPRRDLDDFDTYGSLNDFRKMMSDLNV